MSKYTKQYHDTHGAMDRLECELKYRAPIFQDRPDIKMKKQQLIQMLADRIDMAHRYINLIESADKKAMTKAELCERINQLHDFRLSLKIHTAYGPGQPELWEI